MSQNPMPGALSSPPFYPMEADSRDYPRPRVPLLVPPSWSEWSYAKAPEESAFLRGGESFISGRYALAEGLRRAGAAEGKSVWLPALHCRAMVESVMFTGAEPRFYPVTPDLRPDFAALSDRRVSEPPPAALILTHYFGFPNAVEEAEAFCRSHGIALVEDCAHALYGEVRGRLLGRVGAYAAASLWKFLPVRDGAILLDNRGAKPLRRTEPQSPLAELKGLAGLLQVWERRARRRGSLPISDRAALAAAAERLAGRRKTRVLQPGLKEFSPRLAGIAALRSSRWLTAVGDHERVIRKRREHYLAWLKGMSDLAGGHPLFPELPQGVVPYAFPLLLDDEFGFHLIKQAGVPFWRWEDMAVTPCETARNYRLRLLQLPCHQGLGSEELEWMIHTVRTLVGGGRR